MGRHTNWSKIEQAMMHGRIATPEDKARIAALEKAKRDKRDARRAELERTKPEREKLAAARAVTRAERQTVTAALTRLRIGERYLMGRYKLTSQAGPLLQRLRVLHGLYFTCRMETGVGVWAERINPPHAELASTNANADLL